MAVMSSVASPVTAKPLASKNGRASAWIAAGYGVPSAKRATPRAASASRSAVQAEMQGMPDRAAISAVRASFQPSSMMKVVTMSA